MNKENNEINEVTCKQWFKDSPPQPLPLSEEQVEVVKTFPKLNLEHGFQSVAKDVRFQLLLERGISVF